MAEMLLHAFSRERLLPRGIRITLLVAFVLMSVVPLVMLLSLAAWFAASAGCPGWSLHPT